MRHPKATLPGTPRVPEMPGLANSSLLLVRIPRAGSTAPRPSRALTGSPPGRPPPRPLSPPALSQTSTRERKLTAPHPLGPHQRPVAHGPPPVHAYGPSGFSLHRERARQACDRGPRDSPDLTGRTLLTAVPARPCLGASCHAELSSPCPCWGQSAARVSQQTGVSRAQGPPASRRGPSSAVRARSWLRGAQTGRPGM